MKEYRITREFIGGLLVGMTHTGVYWNQMKVGFTCEHPVGGSPYRIIECVEIEEGVDQRVESQA